MINIYIFSIYNVFAAKKTLHSNRLYHCEECWTTLIKAILESMKNHIYHPLKYNDNDEIQHNLQIVYYVLQANHKRNCKNHKTVLNRKQSQENTI